MQTPYNKEPILENEEVYFMENPKQMTKSYGNYLLDINVNIQVIIIIFLTINEG